jgi:hypothetical protein
MAGTSNTGHMEEVTSAYNILVRKYEGKILDYLGDLGFEWMIIFK